MGKDGVSSRGGGAGRTQKRRLPGTLASGGGQSEQDAWLHAWLPRLLEFLRANEWTWPSLTSAKGPPSITS
jgi:hypothetical protein